MGLIGPVLQFFSRWSYFLVLIFGTACGTTNCRQAREKEGQVVPISKEAQERMDATVSKKQLVQVAISDGSKQCEPGQNLTQEQALEKLKGIRVYSKALKTDSLMRAAACGFPTGKHHVFEIDRGDLAKALEAGFMEWTGE